MPSYAIFADTMAEPQSVYRWLDWLENKLPFPLIRVSQGDLTESVLKMRKTQDGRLYSKTNIPFFTRNHDGGQGKILHRSCTADYKIIPILRELRKLAGIKRGEKNVKVVQWIGISLDEVIRMKPARDAWVSNRWPLVDMGMKRHDCLLWMHRRGFPRPPRSACVYCPYHNNHDWRRLQSEEPAEFQKAVQFEKDLQSAKAQSAAFLTTPFLHRSLLPLAEVDFSTDEDRGQLSLFGNECEGMCGV